MSTMTRNASLPLPALPSFSRIGQVWTEFRAARQERSRIERELNAYTDSELAELGLFRHDVPAVAAGTYRR